jgi:DNA-binding response OmpR family regulator
MTSETVVGKLVLVVDDEADFLATYERLLRRQGYDVVTATTRAAGIDAVGRKHPQLVISDVRLADGSGLDVVRAARGLLNPPPVIVVTGYPSEQSRRAALAAGAAVFLSKPFAASALMAAVQSGLAEGRDARA